MRKPRVNNKIRSNEVQLITHEGENIGVVPIGEAINRAQEVGLDLIEIAPNVKPPVCKIIDYGKYKYELQKKASQAKKKQKIINLKEIKLRPRTDTHDYNFKIKAADKFLVKGDKVKFTIRFKGREMEHMEAANNLIKRIIEDTKKAGKVEQPSKMEGRQMTMIIQPI
ncbi:MAG: translation initiation factor IF-3 [Candidatus Pelagibacter sp.]|nr:translation initiation factor IF-3 [Candidatus Pelagibacter sp.]OUV97998.1 MAG: translation initiation factor IF-3 [Candidatus Pelagibacter sp. TMED142]